MVYTETMNAPAPRPIQGAGPSATLRSGADLAQAGLIARSQVAAADRVGARYSIALTPHVASLIDLNDPDDPIARQYLPSEAELDHAAHERADPIGDDAHAVAPGVVHRYPDRVLLKLLSACPVYCRFCFRRESVGGNAAQMLGGSALDEALAYIAANEAIWEVILTGGDPLALSARRLEHVMVRLAQIHHVKIVRIHSRVPVADPARIDTSLIEAMKACGKTLYVAIHANHPRELQAPAARAALALLADNGIALVSQSVLLKGVNDNANTLAALMRAFVENRVKPYYLHHGDLAPGTAHMRTTIAQGQYLMEQLRGRLSGLALPEYVLDIPGGYGKSPLGPSYINPDATGAARAVMVRDWRGTTHIYEDPE
jgi:lysine 2,3-aminomutase